MPRRSSDNYIQLNKKITQKPIIAIIKTIASETLVSDQEVCYKMITECAQKEIERRKKIAGK